jgi:glutamate-5-semialdehyde dehydrogenase
MTMTQSKTIQELTAGMQLIYDGNQLFTVDEQLASEYKAGDKLVFVKGFSEPVLIPEFATQLVAEKIQRSKAAFYDLASVSDDQLNHFYDAFSNRLSDDAVWDRIKEVNNDDVKIAKEKGRSTTRLIASDKTRANMIAGLLEFRQQDLQRVSSFDQKYHEGWSVDLIKSPLGVVGFVFEGRPNVIADATGVLKSGNTAIFRVGQDARQTANAILEFALYPALDEAKINRDVIQILNRSERSTAWALFSNPDLDLAVARGSGSAVRMLGGIAQMAGVPVSLHGTGGAWMMTNESTDLDRLESAIVGSLDRKVCNTLNTLCLLKSRVQTDLPVVLRALETSANSLGTSYKVHVESDSMMYIDQSLREQVVNIERPNGNQKEQQFEEISRSELGTEWMWESSPEIALVVVDNLNEAISLCNDYSPRFVASLVTQNQLELMTFFNQVNAPFIGNGMTRWVDGQYALSSPELGLSNWENGRFLARSAILSGDSVYTTRIKMNQVQADLKR